MGVCESREGFFITTGNPAVIMTCTSVINSLVYMHNINVLLYQTDHLCRPLKMCSEVFFFDIMWANIYRHLC